MHTDTPPGQMNLRRLLPNLGELFGMWAVSSVCHCYSNLCILPARSWPLNRDNLIPRATWGWVTWAGVTSRNSFLFPLLHQAFLFFLFNWLGKEIGSCDVNKENESLPKVKPAVRQSDALIKWLSSEVDRVTVQEGEHFTTVGTRLGKKRLLTLTSSRLRTAAAASHSGFIPSYGNVVSCSYCPWTLEISWLYNEIKLRWN